MIIKTAEFIMSNTDYTLCPKPDKPEFALIGRSNVGKSSLINMLVNNKKLAKTSSTPGKTQTINHFLINKSWYLVDLPGYGFASVSQTARSEWTTMIENYILHRPNLYCIIILIDSRLDPQNNDVDFITWVGEKGIPMAIALTKTDKLKQSELGVSRNKFEQKLLQQWDELPPIFITSAEKKSGRDRMLEFIEESMKNSEIH